MTAVPDLSLIAPWAGSDPMRHDIEQRMRRMRDVLTELGREVDLLVFGSRRWGPVAWLVLGGTGETLVHGSHCPVAIVPRPADGETGAAGAD
jgi:nucleotide-binding universal stress UspA family protein